MIRVLLCFVLLSPAIAEDQIQFQPGVLAKIYAVGVYPQDAKLTWNEMKADVPGWPIKELPDAPVEVLRLKELPTVEATSLKDIAAKGEPTRLVTSKSGVLRGCNFYAVEFEGYLQSTIDGVSTIGITSDDPVEVFVEGKRILNSDFSASPVRGPSAKESERSFWPVESLDNPILVPDVATAQGTFRLSPNKFYHVLIVARQRWFQAARAIQPNGMNNWIRTVDLNRGAVFRATLCGPDGKTGPLPLQLPVTK